MAKERKKGSKKRTVLFVFEILILLVLLGGLFVYGQLKNKLGNLNSKELQMDKVQMNDLVSSQSLTGYTNIALFGIDSRSTSEEYDAANSDTIIICSINNDTKEVKLCSVYRDTFLVVGQNEYGEDSYQKCNSAYALGGVEQAVSMLNTNLDLNISEYVTTDFNALVTVIDLMGGLEIEMTGAEVEHMNNYCKETSEVTGKSYTEIPRPESDDYVDNYHLNGVQAVSYARIRYTDGLDFKRTERQRLVLQKLVQKAKKSSLATLTSVMDEVFPLIQTSLSKEEIFNMGAGMLSYDFGETTGFPFKHYEANIPNKGDCVIPTTLANNVVELHKFLFGQNDYKVSDTIQSRSDHIVSETGYGYDTETGEVTEDTSITSLAAATATPTYTEQSNDASYNSGASQSSTYDSGYTENTSYDGGATESVSYDSGEGESVSYDSGETESTSDDVLQDSSEYDSGAASYDSGAVSYDSGEEE